MNDLLKSKLEVLAGDEIMLQALRAVLDEQIAKLKPDIEKTNNNQILGEKYRASIEAEKLIKGALEEISSYKQQRSGKKDENRGA